MEEKSIIHNSSFDASASDWKIRHNMYQTSRNYRQLENRLQILQLEKNKKIKNIQNKLNSHKRFVETKIYKHNLKSSIQNNNSQSIMRSSSNSRVFQAIKQSRNFNIKKKQEQMLKTKTKLFDQIKRQREQNQKHIQLQKLKNLETKVNKRNKVRLIEIECKENIQNFWNGRLDSFQEDKKHYINKCLIGHQSNLKRLQKLQKNQQSLLQQIKRTQQVETELKELINNEKSMEGEKLCDLYVSKVA